MRQRRRRGELVSIKRGRDIPLFLSSFSYLSPLIYSPPAPIFDLLPLLTFSPPSPTFSPSPGALMVAGASFQPIKIPAATAGPEHTRQGQGQFAAGSARHRIAGSYSVN